MRLRLLVMLIAALTPEALSEEEYIYPDYLYPDINQKYPSDWLEGGYVRSFDRSMFMDSGIAGMVRWLDMPVPSYPWYGSDLSFYKRLAPPSTFIPYQQYYAVGGSPPDGEIISPPVRLNITQATPYYVFYGSGQGLPFSQYLSLEPSRSSDLWVRGTENWTQYIVSPVGVAVELVANVPGGGSAGFYQTVQTETASLRSGTYQFYEGYSSMSFRPDRIGRHILYLVACNQPSNVVVIDVFAQAPVAQPQSYSPPGSSANAPQTSASAPSLGDTPLTIFYPGLGNFQVFVDGVEVGEGSGGSFTTKVKGGATHAIAIWDGFWMYQNNIYFESGQPKVINVEAV
jgi:hypothetical protein